MFAFFRRYQRALYFLITAVIIFSFSFFGTYSAFISSASDDPVVFTAVDGKKVYRSEFNDVVRFLASDSLLLAERGSEPCNALNDGVIANDIIATGIGDLLVQRFEGEMKTDFAQKLQREKSFRPYVHPQASFISAFQVWSYFSPNLNESLEQLRGLVCDDPLAIYQAKKKVFMAERQFPPMLLRQVLSYQQQQFDWVEPDISLPSRSLCLFNYQQLNDWFGQFFLEKSCEFIMQTAACAREKGMSVTTEEVMASLYQNAQTALKKLPSGSKITPEELLKNSMQELGMDKSRLVSVWENVLLFRKYLIDLSNEIIVNAEPLRSFLKDRFQGRELSLYQVQPALRLKSQNELFAFQFWLNSVAGVENDSLKLPTEFKSASLVKKSFPQLVERNCVLQFSEVSLEDLGKSVRLKDIWGWQEKEDNFAVLEKEIPLLAKTPVASSEQRHDAIANLPRQLREKAEQIAIESIVKEHPLWISNALQKNETKTLSIGIRTQGGNLPLSGIKDGESFIKVLSKSVPGEQDKSLLNYTQDDRHFYKIVVLDMAKEDSLVPLPELQLDGTLSGLLDRMLESAYPKIRTSKPGLFRNDKGEWKSFPEAKEVLSETYFSSLLKQIDAKLAEYKSIYPKYCHFDDLKSARVATRFLPHLLVLSDRLKNGEDRSLLVTSPFVVQKEQSQASIIEKRPLTDLWLLVESRDSLTKEELARKPQFVDAFLAAMGSFMAPKYSREIGPFVAKVDRCYEDDFQEDLRAMVYGCQSDLGSEAVVQKSRILMVGFFPKVDSK
jgi:GcvH upstream region-like protein